MFDIDIMALVGHHFSAVFGSIFLYGLLGFLGTLAALFTLYRFGLLKRNNGLLKFFVGTYWVFLPLVVGGTFAYIGAIKGTVNVIEEDVNNTVAMVEEAIFPSFHTYITENFEELVGYQSLDSVVNNYVDEQAELEKDGLAARALHWTLSASLSAAEMIASDQVSEFTGLKEDNVKGSLHALRTSNLDNLHHNFWGMTCGLVNSQVRAAAAPLYLPGILVLLLALLFPAAEITVVALRKRRQAGAAEAPAAEATTENE